MQEVHEDLDGQYIHNLIPSPSYNIEDCSFEANDYIIINTTNRIAITSGYVLDLQISSIKVLLDRYINIFHKIFRYFLIKEIILNYSNLTANYMDQIFTIDKLESRGQMIQHSYSSLYALMKNHPSSNYLRRFLLF